MRINHLLSIIMCLGFGLQLTVWTGENYADELPKHITSIIDNAPMILIPAGEFKYGMSQTELDTNLKKLGTHKSDLFKKTIDERPEDLPAYYIDKYEVTNEQYKVFVKATGHRKPRFINDKRYNDDRQPVVGIGIQDAKDYAKWSGKRLPKEEEWEKAARGVDGNLWPWGNVPSSKKYNGKRQANWLPVSVGSFPAGNSPFGLSDMAGNVWEMTTGVWDSTSPAMRGGCFLNAGALTLTVTRWAPDEQAETKGATWLGFRCVMDITDEVLKNIKIEKSKKSGISG